MYSKILVPLDSSELAEQALPHVIGNALAHDAAVHLDAGNRPGGHDLATAAAHDRTDRERWCEPDRTAALEAWAASAGEYLDSVATRLREAGVNTVTSNVLRGNPYELIRAEAAAVDADLIVIASHGRSGLGRAVTGSVADHVIRETPESAVLVIRPRSEN